MAVGRTLYCRLAIYYGVDSCCRLFTFGDLLKSRNKLNQIKSPNNNTKKHNNNMPRSIVLLGDMNWAVLRIHYTHGSIPEAQGVRSQLHQ